MVLPKIRVYEKYELDRDTWTKQLDRLGPETVRMRLNNGEVGSGPHSAVAFIVNHRDGSRRMATREFLEEWLAKKDEAAGKRANRQNALIWIATIAAVVGAVAGLAGLWF